MNTARRGILLLSKRCRLSFGLSLRVGTPQVTRWYSKQPNNNINNNINNNNNAPKQITLNWRLSNKEDKEEKEEEREREEMERVMEGTIHFMTGFAKDKNSDGLNNYWKAVSDDQHSQALDYATKYGVNVRDDFGNTALHVAAFYGNNHLIHSFIKLGADPFIFNNQGASPLLVAAYGAHLDVIDSLLGCGLSIEERDNAGNSIINYSLLSDSPSFIEALIKTHSLSLNSPSSLPPLILASQLGKCDLIHLLLKLGANINIIDDAKRSPLHYAVLCNNMEVVQLLINNNASLNSKDCNNDTPLHWAIFNKFYGIVEELCKNGGLKEEGDEGLLCISLAMREEEIKSLEILKRYGANLNVILDGGNNILQKAIQSNKSGEMIEALVKLGVSTKHRNEKKNTPLQAAIIYNNKEAIKRLNKMRVEMYEEGVTGPIHVAASFGRLEMIKLLVSFGVPVNCKDSSSWTPLHHASLGGHVDCIKWLVLNGASIKERDERNGSPLHYAGSAESVRELVSLGLPLEEKAFNGLTPLYAAIIASRPSVIEALVKAGANTGGETQISPVSIALSRGYGESLETLVSLGVPLHPPNTSHPLKVITENDHPHLVKSLLELGVNLSATDGDGNRICFIKSAAMVDALVDSGMDVNVKDKEGKTLLTYAGLELQKDVSEALKRRGAI